MTGNVQDQRQRVCDSWQIAARVLSISVEAPYVIKKNDLIDIPCVAYLPDFGSANGMVIGLTSDPSNKAIQSAAVSLQLYYSFINPDFYQHYNDEEFQEALVDWGFFGDEERRPDWLEQQVKLRHIITKLEHEWSEPEGFLSQAREGVFDRERGSAMLALLKDIRIPSNFSLDRRLVSTLWHLPAFLTSQKDRIAAYGEELVALSEMTKEIHGLVERILGMPKLRSEDRSSE